MAKVSKKSEKVTTVETTTATPNVITQKRNEEVRRNYKNLSKTDREKFFNEIVSEFKVNKSNFRNQIEELLSEEFYADLAKFESKNNISAGGRVRKTFVELMKLSFSTRKNIQEKRNNLKGTKKAKTTKK